MYDTPQVRERGPIAEARGSASGPKCAKLHVALGYIGLNQNVGTPGPCGIRHFHPSVVGRDVREVVPHAQPLADLALDEARRRLYVVNTAANAVEVFGAATNPPRLTNTIRTDSTPLSIAMSRTGKYLYVACYGAFPCRSSICLRTRSPAGR